MGISSSPAASQASHMSAVKETLSNILSLNCKHYILKRKHAHTQKHTIIWIGQILQHANAHVDKGTKTHTHFKT